MDERQFGTYQLVRQIAVGGMAEIHLAKVAGIAGFEKYVALKMIHPNFSCSDQFVQMLIDEAKLTVQLQHVNIAQTFDLGRVGDIYYFTMEYVDGLDLYELLRRAAEAQQPTPVEIAAYIGKEIACGLDYAHRKRDLAGRPLGIIHRDVSPQNVLISYSGEVKLVDFGIAKTLRIRETSAGVIKGKYYYMSPEQARGEAVDHRSDIFSAGIVLYEVLTGQMAYLEKDARKLLQRVRNAMLPSPRQLRGDIPEELERMVVRAVAKQPDDRYPTVGDFAADLERFLHRYEPVCTASRLAAYVRDMLERPQPQRAGEMTAAGARAHAAGKRVTKRITNHSLVRARSELRDENSVIFRLDAVPGAPEAERGSSPRPESPRDRRGFRDGNLATREMHGSQPAAKRGSQRRELKIGLVECTALIPRERLASLGFDEVPQFLKKGRRRGSRWLLGATIAVACIAAGALFGTYLLGAEAESGVMMRIESTPSGATVWVDGVRLDQKTPVAFPLAAPSKPHRVQYFLPGYKPATKLVRVNERDAEAIARGVLERLASRPSVESIGRGEVSSQAHQLR